MILDFLIIGAGFAGCVVSQKMAEAGYKVLLIDKRSHIGGNAYDELNKHGILIHKYGPHIFHTNSDRIYNYLSNFTEWRVYEHHVKASIDGKLYSIPINQNTINSLYSLNLDEDGINDFYQKVREVRNPVLTSEDVVLNTVGKDLYEKFFKNYTKKQWGLDASKLNATVTARIPVRNNKDDRYFTDKYQVMPKHGYTNMFKKMIDHPNISLELNADYFEKSKKVTRKHTVYTGPIDAYYNYCFGKLPYRSLKFEHEYIADIGLVQPVGTINYPNDYDYTRITEFKHLTGQKCIGSAIAREYPQSNGDPYYPIPTKENDTLYKKYETLSLAEKNVTFVGRLAQYKYYNMDQVVGAALKCSEELNSFFN